MAKKKIPPTQPNVVAATAPAQMPSIRNLVPLEEGGRHARSGFEFQDEVAAGMCLEMLLGSGPSEVWCETEDDVVQVWRINGQEVFEFVQVKGDDPESAWTVARLCKREAEKDGKGPGRCLIQKSLAHDRGAEICRFRLVTRRDPDEALLPLVHPFGSEERKGDVAGRADLARDIEGRIGPVASSNGRGIDFWTENLAWSCFANRDYVVQTNLNKMAELADAWCLPLSTSQRGSLHRRLFRRIQDASIACGKTRWSDKRLVRQELSAWLKGQADEILHPSQSGTTAALERKLAAAGVPGTTVELAKSQRMRYRSELLKPHYMPSDALNAFEAEAEALLLVLKVQLDAGCISDTGQEFHARCVRVVEELGERLCMGRSPAYCLPFGYLYDLMNRCRLDLTRATA